MPIERVSALEGLQQFLDLWDSGIADVERADELTRELARILASIDRPDSDVEEAIGAFVRQLPAAAKEFLRTDALLPSSRGASMGAKVTNVEDYVEVPIFFVTDRDKDVSDGAVTYVADHGPLECGEARVAIPRSRHVGSFPTPRWWRFEVKQHPSKHICVTSHTSMGAKQFTDALCNPPSDSRDILLCVHGYNVSFTEAVSRAAQVAQDIRFPGRTIVFSWPSAGRVLAYLRDEERAARSVDSLSSVLSMVIKDVRPPFLHILSHSMGGRIVLSAVSDILRAFRRLDNCCLVFAAPDVWQREFAHKISSMCNGVSRVTLYASHRDLTMRLSKLLHAGSRAGEAGSALVVLPGIDTIDASKVDCGLFGLGHSYYADRRSILSDLHHLAVHKTSPPRFDLERRRSAAGEHWVYRC